MKPQLESGLQALNDEIQAVRQFDSVALATMLHAVEKKAAEQITALFKNAMEKAADSFATIHMQLSSLANTQHHSATAVSIDFEGAKKALRALDAVSLKAKAGEVQNQPSARDRTAIQQIVRETLLSQQTVKSSTRTPSIQRSSKAEKQRRADFRAQIARRKARSTCGACKKIGHWAGDTECSKTKRERDGKATMLASSAEDETREDEESSFVFFR